MVGWAWRPAVCEKLLLTTKLWNTPSSCLWGQRQFYQMLQDSDVWNCLELQLCIEILISENPFETTWDSKAKQISNDNKSSMKDKISLPQGTQAWRGEKASY